MRIHKIKFINYRQYKNDEITFLKTTDNDLYILLASNGVGKTNFLNGLNWCLYESEPHLGAKNKTLPMVNLTILDECSVGDKIEVLVEIQLKTKTKTIWLSRKATFRKTETNTPFQLSNDFQIQIQDTTDNKGTSTFTNDGANQELNRILPEGIREFFFFDGERLNNYFIDENGVRIESSIKEISKIKHLNKMINRLNKLLVEYQRKLGRQSPNIEQARKNLEEISVLKLHTEEELENCKQQIHISKSKIEESKEFLRGQDNIEEQEIRRSSFKENLLTIQQKIGLKTKELQDHIRNYFTLVSFYPFFKKLLAEIESKSASGKLPPPISKETLELIISVKKCEICDSSLDVSQINKIIKKLKLYDLSSGSSRILVEIKGSLENFILKTEKHKEISGKILRELDELEKDDDKIKSLISKIDIELSKYSDDNKEKIKNAHNQRMNNEKLLVINIERKGRLKGSLNNFEKQYLKLECELDFEIKKDKTSTLLKQKLRFIKTAHKVANTVSNEIMTEIREKIRDETEKIFFDFIWKKDTYKHLQLSENYEIGLTHKNDLECLGSLSAAERALLALAFTLALHNISGFDAPLVVDTPVARISGRNRTNFAETLAETSKQKQLILFFTHAEYSDDIKICFEHILSSFTKLSLNQSEQNIIMENNNE